MAEGAPAPARKRLLIGTLAVLLLVVIAAAAGVVIWYTVLDDLPVPEIITIGNDGDDATEAPAETPVTTEEEQAGQRSSSDDPQETPATQQGVLIVPQEIKLIDIIPSPQIVTLNGPGQSQRLTVQGFYSDGSTGDLVLEPGEEFFFASSDTSVAEVAHNGVVSSLKAGGADVLVAYRNFEAEVPVLVWGDVRQIPPIDPDRLLPIDEDGTAIVLNRVMVELEPGYGLPDAEEVATSIGGKVIFEYRTFPGYIVEIGARSQEELDDALSLLNKNQRVARSYPDMVAAADNGGGPALIETNLLDPNKREAYDDSGMVRAWTLMRSIDVLDPVIVAVIDDGFVPPRVNTGRPAEDSEVNLTIADEFTRIELFNSTPELSFDRFGPNTIYVEDLVEGENNFSHGTSIVSILASKNNVSERTNSRNGFSGVITSVRDIAYTIIVYSVDSEVDSQLGEWENKAVNLALSNLYNALEQTQKYENQVDVVNLSLSFPCRVELDPDDVAINIDKIDLNDEIKCDYFETLHSLIKKMSETTFVVSAGNGYRNIYLDLIENKKDKNKKDKNKKDKNKKDKWYATTIPAVFGGPVPKDITLRNDITLPNVITVGGTENNHAKHAISNYGKEVAIGAPFTVWALSIGRIFDDSSDKNHIVKRKYKFVKGTSFSATLVSGTVALLKAIDPHLKPDEIKRILKESGRPMLPGQPSGMQWPLLDAGLALEKAIAAEIFIAGSRTWNTDTDRLDVTVYVKNTGFVESRFLLEAVEGGSGRVLDSKIESVIPIIGENGAPKAFELSLEITHDAVVELKLYRFPNRMYLIDSSNLVIPLPPALLTPGPTEIEGVPVPFPESSGACLPPSGAPEAYSQKTRGRMIEVATFQKPSAVSSAMLMFNINNPSSSSGPFFIKEEILSHPDQFGWFNESPMREIGIRPGGTAHLLITPNPNDYTHPESGKREFDLDWETFNFGCELEIRLSVFADEAGSVLLDYVTLRERMEPFQREPWEQTSEPGFVVTPVPFPVTNAEVSAKAGELKRRLEPITDLITSRTEGFSGGCTGVISEWEEMYIGIQELYLYPTSQLKMGVLERIEMMLNEFIPKWERAGCL